VADSPRRRDHPDGRARLNVGLLLPQRGRLKLEATASYAGPPPFGAPQDRIWLTITNVGGKPVHVVWVGWGLREAVAGERVRSVVPFEAKKLDPEAQISVPVFEPAHLHRNVAWIGARETRGRLFKVTAMKMRRLIRDRERRMHQTSEYTS